MCAHRFFFLAKGSSKTRTRSDDTPRAKVSNDLPTLLKLLAYSHGVLQGSVPQKVQLSEEERALVAAVISGDASEVSRLLVSGRAGLELDEGDVLLHIACRNPSDRVIAAIARMRPDLNSANIRGRTPLHELAENGGSLAVLGSLVKLGADPFARDNLGNSPAMLIASESLCAGFEKWLSSHNYVAPDVTQNRNSLIKIPIFTKSGKQSVAEVSAETTVVMLLENLPLELAALRPHAAHLSLVEYRRKNGDLPPKLSLLASTQLLVPLTQTWGEDPLGLNTLHRLLLVPVKAAPREAVAAYESGGYGQIGYKK